MCGITGYILKSPQACEADTLSRLWQGIRRRGPDDEGGILVYRSRREVRAIVSGRTHQALVASGGKLEPPVPRHDVALFHTRYSIIDLSPAAHQPFRSRDGACWLIFNGEIYNYLELRQLLEAQGVPCRTSSDTEVLAEGWRLWKHGLWPKLNGFWAAALYDATDNSVVLSRDRLGVAPFYYRETARGVYFSSLIAPLLAVEPGGYELDRDSVRGYLDTGLKDHDGTTMYRQVRSLPPATAVTFPQGGEAAILGSDVRTFWTLPEKPWQEKELGFEEAVRQVRSTLVDAVRLRLRADVPLAFELSGGLDSSSVVAAAAEQLDRRLTVYTIQVPGLDESPYARALARRFNLDHRVLSGLEEDLPRDAESFARVMEEPYDTPANYVHHRMLRKIKSDGFHVVLTGAGGDEALAGYEADFWPAAWREWRRGGPGARWQADWYEFCRRFGTVRETRRTLMNYARALAGWVGIKRVVGPEAPSSRALVHLNDY
ncbi:MAG: asparagine synthase (glutamine-hydrolyzing), partial [Candidatus Omnitrophica bacterium]|nr:asparagine synthase (glutamine-hydrolyzing) [Candidatus Omnitrophota bacterium]